MDATSFRLFWVSVGLRIDNALEHRVYGHNDNRNIYNKNGSVLVICDENGNCIEQGQQ